MQVQTADFDYTDFSKPRAGDERLAIRFFVKAKQDAEATAKADPPRPIFKESEFIQIMVPGDKNQAHVRPVAPGDKVRFHKQYEHWKATRTNDLVTGTPLEAWNILTLAQIEEYRYFGVRTIEQMADLRDDVVGQIPGTHNLKAKAKAWMALMKEEAPMRKVQAELDARDKQIADLMAAVAAQGEELKALREERQAGGKSKK